MIIDEINKIKRIIKDCEIDLINLKGSQGIANKLKIYKRKF